MGDETIQHIYKSIKFVLQVSIKLFLIRFHNLQYWLCKHLSISKWHWSPSCYKRLCNISCIWPVLSLNHTRNLYTNFELAFFNNIPQFVQHPFCKHWLNLIWPTRESIGNVHYIFWINWIKIDPEWIEHQIRDPESWFNCITINYFPPSDLRNIVTL